MIDINKVQKFLEKEKIDGWLLYDFHFSNDLAISFLNLKDKHLTRRIFYWIPQKGMPIKIVHSVEEHLLDELEGEKIVYLSWQSLHQAISKILKDKKKVAMEYSKDCAIPYVSKVDGGTIDLIRKQNVEVVSSGSFLPYFTSVLSEDQIKTHCLAANELDEIANNIWQWIAKGLLEEKKISEYDVQQKILSLFEEKNLITASSPICAVNAHAANPHYSPQKDSSSIIKKKDLILIDLWCKTKDEKAVFGDITRVAVADENATERQKEIFSIVRKAQKKACDFIKKKLSEKNQIQGWEVDNACRDVIQSFGYGEFFKHRTGHSIDTSVHGSGANLDDLEMHDERFLLEKNCFSIEPGIYLPNEFGIRLEHDAYIENQQLIITGGIEEELKCLF